MMRCDFILRIVELNQVRLMERIGVDPINYDKAISRELSKILPE